MYIIIDMNQRKYIKTFIDKRFFDMPPNKLNSFFTAKKFGVLDTKIEDIKPFIYLVNKTNIYDKFIVEHAFNFNHVFLKEDAFQRILDGSISKDEYKDLINAVKTLKEAYVSIVLFPEKDYTVFGDFEKLSQKATNFLVKTTYNLKFIDIAGMFYAYPIWSPVHRKCDVKINEVGIVPYVKYRSLSEEDANFLINNSLPSSASIYAKRMQLEILTNNRAAGLDRIIYCCPKCKTLFDVYSEYNCLKCNNCGSAIEIGQDGNILFCNDVDTFDDLKAFQYELLTKTIFAEKELKSYNNTFYATKIKTNKFKFIPGFRFSIMTDRIFFSKAGFSKEILIKNMKYVGLLPSNIISIILKDGSEFYFKGDGHENFYLLVDLFNIQTNKN